MIVAGVVVVVGFTCVVDVLGVAGSVVAVDDVVAVVVCAGDAVVFELAVVVVQF